MENVTVSKWATTVSTMQGVHDHQYYLPEFNDLAKYPTKRPMDTRNVQL